MFLTLTNNFLTGKTLSWNSVLSPFTSYLSAVLALSSLIEASMNNLGPTKLDRYMIVGGFLVLLGMWIFTTYQVIRPIQDEDYPQVFRDNYKWVRWNEAAGRGI